MSSGSYDLSERPIHLGLNATASPQPPFTGDPAWYEAYGERHSGDGAEGRLVSWHSFSENWESWEMHPAGSEVVLCGDGTITLIQEGADGQHARHTLHPGEYAINAPGVWHTADVEARATAVFITAGEGTRHRPR
ncbi:cupin [Erythrobacter sp. LQ02-29]|uniref:cupin n=1 Tax=Erythrobacter sp. LQ02-29 TaxID=2920384 RepID=UPI001F4E47C5|nr:cupin [Erythrobacter sp. LQ02-29]MCP9222011.1 cupin [Erythrobacter sp. LQ02-29]